MRNVSHSKRIIEVLVLILAMYGFSACKSSATSDNSLPSLPTPTPTPTPTPDPDDDDSPVIEEGKFKVVLGDGLATGLSHYIHHEDGFDEPCEVSVDDADQDIECYIEVVEQDLEDHGLSYTFSATSDYCTYVRHMPYFYADRDFGTGPTNVSFDVTSGVVSNAVNADPVTGDPICTFDYTDADGPNCCGGEYTLSITDTNTLVTTITTEDWGGKGANCLDGAAMLSQAKTDNGFPIQDVFFLGIGAGGGLAETYNLDTGAVRKGYSTFFANFFDPADHPTSGIPTGFDRDLDGVVDAGNPYYELLCEDQGEEVRARIRLIVREWNELAEYEEGDSGDPDTEGVDPLDPTGGDLNDVEDWKDFGDNFTQKLDKD